MTSMEQPQHKIRPQERSLESHPPQLWNPKLVIQGARSFTVLYVLDKNRKFKAWLLTIHFRKGIAGLLVDLRPRQFQPPTFTIPLGADLGQPPHPSECSRHPSSILDHHPHSAQIWVLSFLGKTFEVYIFFSPVTTHPRLHQLLQAFPPTSNSSTFFFLSSEIFSFAQKFPTQPSFFFPLFWILNSLSFWICSLVFLCLRPQGLIFLIRSPDF